MFFGSVSEDEWIRERYVFIARGRMGIKVGGFRDDFCYRKRLEEMCWYCRVVWTGISYLYYLSGFDAENKKFSGVSVRVIRRSCSLIEEVGVLGIIAGKFFFGLGEGVGVRN